MPNLLVIASLALGLLATTLDVRPVVATDEADEAMPGTVTVIKPGKLMKFVTKPATGGTFALPGAANDPTVEGGTLRVFDTGTTAGDNIYALPVQPAPYGWKALGGGSRGYKYKGAGTPADPCRVVLIKTRVVKGVCRSGSVTLAPPFTGDVGIILTAGSDSKRYCARFGGSEVKNDPVLLKRKQAAAAACPVPPPLPPPGDSIFVDVVTGDDGDPGTMAAPKATVQAGINAAQLAGVDVYVSTGSYTESITLADGVSVFGGYNAAGGWSFSPGNVVTIIGDTTAVLGTNIDAETHLDQLTIIAADNTAPGGSSYGLYVVSSNGLVVSDVTVEAGAGGAGSSGATGSLGAGGIDGGQGNPGCEDSSGLCSSCSQPPGGPAGASSCGRTGGIGGLPGHAAACGSVGGPGVGGTAGGPGGCPDGTTGSDGVPGMIGPTGPGGASFGTVAAAGYLGAAGFSGGLGTHGNGGGGGGGGSGGEDNCDSYGSSGGGGGGGGCAGGGGNGGSGGGGSFAIYLWSSSLSLADSAIRTGDGGAGGAGGTGGNGGSAGGGGLGGPYGGSGEQDDGGNGAPGGAGGAGGAGGQGGGGGGGPSIGISCGNGSTLSIDTGNGYVLGNGGTGGAAPGPGSNGVQQQTNGC